MKSTQADQRKLKDLKKLMTSKYQVILEEGKHHEFSIVFPGPKGSDYEGVSGAIT